MNIRSLTKFNHPSQSISIEEQVPSQAFLQTRKFMHSSLESIYHPHTILRITTKLTLTFLYAQDPFEFWKKQNYLFTS